MRGFQKYGRNLILTVALGQTIENSISCVFLESPHQVDMKNVVKCYKHFVCYFHALKTNGALYTSILKIHIFWEGHKILRNLHLTFVPRSASGDFSKFCGLLRIYELYSCPLNIFPQTFSQCLFRRQLRKHFTLFGFHKGHVRTSEWEVFTYVWHMKIFILGLIYKERVCTTFYVKYLLHIYLNPNLVAFLWMIWS